VPGSGGRDEGGESKAEPIHVQLSVLLHILPLHLVPVAATALPLTLHICSLYGNTDCCLHKASFACGGCSRSWRMRPVEAGCAPPRLIYTPSMASAPQLKAPPSLHRSTPTAPRCTTPRLKASGRTAEFTHRREIENDTWSPQYSRKF
jgi:hypothetical protein